MHLDGKFTGPESFSGPIDIALKTCHDLPVVSFERIELLDFPVLQDTKDLSTDQKYLWDICPAVISRECPFDLS